MLRLGRFAMSTLFGTLACALCAADLGPGLATRVSLGNMGVEGNGHSYEGSVSNNGKIIAFYSQADNLHPDATSGEYQVFTRDLRTGETQLISRAPNGDESNDYNEYPHVSANGKRVVYSTDAVNITPDSANGRQVVLYDARTGLTTLVSGSNSDELANGGCNLYDTRPLSGNGRWVVFKSTSSNLVDGDADGFQDIFLYDHVRGTTERISNGIGDEANGSSNFPAISPNGRWILYCSTASNIVAGDGNMRTDVFLYDRVRKTTRIVSVADDEAPANGHSDYTASTISNNGRYVAFSSAATNLVPGDLNGNYDLFLRDLREETTVRISVGPGPNFDEGDADAGTPAITPNGRSITYWTYASNMVDPTDTVGYDQVIFDRRTGLSRRVLEDRDGGDTGASGPYSYWAQMSPNGRWLMVADDGIDIVAGDGNGVFDVFLVDLR